MRRGQTTMEMTAALVILMMLLVASVRIFVWLNDRLVTQQKQYESTRALAGGSDQQGMIANNMPPVGDLYNVNATEGRGNLYQNAFVPLNIFEDPS